MGLDYSATLPDRPLFGIIDDKELRFALPAFALLQEKTGIDIDPYGKSRLYPDHARLVLAALADSPQPVLREFRQVLQAAIDNNVVLHFCGD